MISFTVRFIALIAEIIFMLLPITLLINSLYGQNSKTFKLTLTALIIYNPYLIFMSSLNAYTSSLMFIGSMLFTFWFMIENHLEISIGFFAFALNLN